MTAISKQIQIQLYLYLFRPADRHVTLSTYLVSVKVLVPLKDFFGGLAGLDSVVVIVAMPFLH